MGFRTHVGSLKTVGWVGGDYLGLEKVSFIKHRVQKSYLIYDQMASIDTLFMATTSENSNCVFLYSPYKEYLPPSLESPRKAKESLATA